MNKEEMEFIRESTNNVFEEKDIPELYTEILTHKAELEKGLGFPVTFNDAVFSFLENVFIPIMREIENSLALRLTLKDLSFTQTYFELSREMKDSNCDDAHTAALRIINLRNAGLMGKIIKAIA